MKRGLPAVREQVAKLEHENAKLKRAVTEQTWRNLERIDLKRALDSIAHYVAEGWNADSDADWSALADILRGTGYDIGWPGEPEPFIHGDNAEGAEG